MAVKNKVMIEPTIKENKMVELIKNDPKLDVDTKREYKTLAEFFVLDFGNNLNKTSIELDDLTQYGIDTWKEFLVYPPIRKYIESFIHEKINKNVDQALASGQGSRDAIGVKKAMDTMNNATNNEYFVVFRLPDKEDYEPSGEF